MTPQHKTSFEVHLRNILTMSSKGRSWKVDSGRSWDGQIRSSGDILGTLEENAPGCTGDQYLPAE